MFLNIKVYIILAEIEDSRRILLFALIKKLDNIYIKIKNKFNIEKEKIKNMKTINEIIYDTYNIYNI